MITVDYKVKTEQITEAIRTVMIKFAGEGDTAQILKKYRSMDAFELLQLLECSLNAHKDLLELSRKQLKATTLKLAEASQAPLL